MIKEFHGVTIADKAIIYSIITCCLIAVRFDCDLFYSFAIGFSIGATVFNYMLIRIGYLKSKKQAELAWEEAKRTQQEHKEMILKRYGHIPGWYRE